WRRSTRQPGTGVMSMVMAVSFQRYGRLYYLDPGEHTPAVGDKVLVPTDAGPGGAEGLWGPQYGSGGVRGLPVWGGIASEERPARDRAESGPQGRGQGGREEGDPASPAADEGGCGRLPGSGRPVHDLLLGAASGGLPCAGPGSGQDPVRARRAASARRQGRGA